MLKKISIYFVLLFTVFSTFILSVSAAGDIKGGILGSIGDHESVITNTDGKDGVNYILEYSRDTIFGLLALIGIAVFLFIGYKIIIAKGNPEEFKKAFLMLVYAIIGIVFVSLSWVLVSFISGINI